MTYPQIREGVFLSRPNRFIAQVQLDGQVETCHVKNTGRCRELLTPQARVYVNAASNPARKTKFDLVAVWKGDRLINMDSQAPNQVAAEWIQSSGMFGAEPLVRPECGFGNSRLDFYVEIGTRKIFLEVKGVTLEEDGVVLFPDAPTARGVKHVKELMECVRAGYEAWLLFLIQMRDVRYFTPNRGTHAEFADVLREAQDQGVTLWAIDCKVTPDAICAGNRVPVVL